jgi:hypothetical protein
MQVTAETREFIKQNIKRGDLVKITMCFDDNHCEHCAYDIGLDDEMYESEGQWLHVDGIGYGYSDGLQCGAQVVDAQHFLWSTCWMSEVTMFDIPTPSWEA